jgi:hypothetical protein
MAKDDEEMVAHFKIFLRMAGISCTKWAKSINGGTWRYPVLLFNAREAAFSRVHRAKKFKENSAEYQSETDGAVRKQLLRAAVEEAQQRLIETGEDYRSLGLRIGHQEIDGYFPWDHPSGRSKRFDMHTCIICGLHHNTHACTWWFSKYHKWQGQRHPNDPALAIVAHPAVAHSSPVLDPNSDHQVFTVQGAFKGSARLNGNGHNLTLHISQLNGTATQQFGDYTYDLQCRPFSTEGGYLTGTAEGAEAGADGHGKGAGGVENSEVERAKAVWDDMESGLGRGELYNLGYDRGFSEGYYHDDQGREQGFREGYDLAYGQGEQYGRDQGYHLGYQAALAYHQIGQGNGH